MTDRPHVILDALLVRAAPTGVGRSILELVGALAAAPRPQRFTVLATVPEMFSDLAGRDDWQIVPCPAAAGGNLRKSFFTQLKLPGLVRELGGDLLHSLQYVAPLRLSVPSVVTVHDLAFWRFPETVEQPRRAYYRWLVPRSLRSAAAIVTNSQSTAADVADRFPELTDRIQVTPFGTPSWVQRQAVLADGAPGSESGAGDVPQRPYLLFVGTLEPRKNLERLLAAYPRYRSEARARGIADRDIPRLLLVGGRGWKDTTLRQQMASLVAEGCLEVRDYCETEELYRYYRSARGVLLPSLHEGFGFPILEAMALGTPVLTANRGGHGGGGRQGGTAGRSGRYRSHRRRPAPPELG